MEQQGVTKVRCQRIGCEAMFSEDDNPEGSCQYHASVCPIIFLFFFFTFNYVIFLILCVKVYLKIWKTI